MAQTYRSGTADIDALDYIEMFLESDHQVDPAVLNDTYVLENFRPVVTKRLRCEDYIYRLWVQQQGIAAAHVDAAQNHGRSNYMQSAGIGNSLKEVSNLLKRKIKASLTRLDELWHQAFDYEGAAERPPGKALRVFASNLHKTFYGFEPDFFQHNLLRIVDDVVSVIKGSIELWPTLVEICYFQKGRKGLPQIRVANPHK